jgi:hypothetical protein
MKDTKAGLNAPDSPVSANQPRNTVAKPEPSTNALQIPDGPPPPLDVIQARAMRTAVLASKLSRELQHGPIGAQQGGYNSFEGTIVPWIWP